jgi:hypothetical protein
MGYQQQSALKQERRSSERHFLNASVFLTYRGMFYPGEIKNINASGLYIKTRSALPDTAHCVEVFCTSNSNLRAMATVVYHDENGVGLHLDDESDQVCLGHLLQNVQRRPSLLDSILGINK